MLVTAKELLQKAYRRQYAIPAFNVDNLEMLLAVVSAAEEARSPIIIATSESSLEYAGFHNLRALVYLAAEGKATLALHLDHGKNLDLIKRCIDGGWTSVMFDGSDLSYEENVKKTKMVVAWARKRGVSVEAELGALGTDEDLTKEGATHFTDPAQAVDFVRRTGIDALAISIGTTHGPFKARGAIHLDFKRLAEIKRKHACRSYCMAQAEFRKSSCVPCTISAILYTIAYGLRVRVEYPMHRCERQFSLALTK